MTEGSHKIKLPFQQKSRSPHQASQCARATKPRRLSKTCAFSLPSSLRLYALRCSLRRFAISGQKGSNGHCTRTTKPVKRAPSCTRALRKSEQAAVFLSPTPGWNPNKKGLEQKRMFLSCARAVKKRRMGCCASFPPLPAGTKAHFSVLHARSGENKNNRLCFSPPLPAGA